MAGVHWWVRHHIAHVEGGAMDLHESMIWFSITTVCVVALLLGGVFMATHTYDRHDKRIPH
jgi:hypothetical protein